MTLKLDDKPLLTRGLPQSVVNDMKQDYLWNKTGEDPEIERLEHLMSAFRYQETAAPLIQVAEPVRVVEPKRSWGFSFAFAFAGSVLAVILLGVWFQFLNGNRQTGSDQVAVTPSSIVSEKPQPDSYSMTADSGVDKVDNKEVTAVTSSTIFRQRSRNNIKRNVMATTVSSRKNRPIKLTNEEKYAYGQLMLALSITGSKLKMVRDTINGED